MHDRDDSKCDEEKKLIPGPQLNQVTRHEDRERKGRYEVKEG
jgi:hypothetical protein